MLVRIGAQRVVSGSKPGNVEMFQCVFLWSGCYIRGPTCALQDASGLRALSLQGDNVFGFPCDGQKKDGQSRDHLASAATSGHVHDMYTPEYIEHVRDVRTNILL